MPKVDCACADIHGEPNSIAVNRPAHFEVRNIIIVKRQRERDEPRENWSEWQDLRRCIPIIEIIGQFLKIV
jgi:hypothetical protein